MMKTTVCFGGKNRCLGIKCYEIVYFLSVICELKELIFNCFLEAQRKIKCKDKHQLSLYFFLSRKETQKVFKSHLLRVGNGTRKRSRSDFVEHLAGVH